MRSPFLRAGCRDKKLDCRDASVSPIDGEAVAMDDEDADSEREEEDMMRDNRLGWERVRSSPGQHELEGK